MKKRLFLSIALPAPVREKLWHYTHKLLSLSKLSFALKPVAQDNLHITLYFIGSVQELLLPSLKEKIQDACTGASQFSLQYDKCTFVPQKNYPKLIWVQFRGNQEYATLVQKLDSVLRDFIKPASGQHKEHIPHATLARFKKQINISGIELEEVSIPDIAVTSFELMSSRLTPAGPLYEQLASFKLNE